MSNNLFYRSRIINSLDNMTQLNQSYLTGYSSVYAYSKTMIIPNLGREPITKGVINLSPQNSNIAKTIPSISLGLNIT